MARPAGQFEVHKRKLFALLRDEGFAAATNAQLADRLDCTPRQVARYLAQLARDGAVRTERVRWKHPSFGWCNARTLQLVGTPKRPPMQHNSKVSSADAHDIRLMYARREMNQAQLAKHYRISQAAVSDIVNFRTWKD